ncbi:protein translocase subunit SecF [Methanococcus maripaludis]|uniref:Protein-export membrane protein SecF n=2 Tax=Methanococcus maripaludis TaxID=39152 RepID=Q6LX29_METMP|nr:protein translocase subunit SecF [Methanococcus maripaludis]MBA2839692.1 preprotein translocase subunit SecF [Methanococcus maripaludis]MBA2852269.1 preprotein translocase subunit SecF [Methanococcus maripaludis]MBA2859410.1 preprotein translocase subunit SecF [Methanococcus maripaludis]MBB6401380.1 preprotein translocase subunit SecF [Methanococcus maripaludis]CAF31080.1 SecD/SecF/SecDF export membrane protein [Methanococcus maripaludis S2]
MNINYKVLTIIPIILALLSLTLVSVNGLKESIDVSGGTEISILAPANTDLSVLKEQLPDSEVKISESSIGTFVVIKSGLETDVDSVRAVVKEFFNVEDLSELSYTEKQIGSVLSSKFWEEGMKAVGFAFIFMAIVVYAIFRTPVPSGAVILAAASDMAIAVGGMSLFNIPISTATIAALLMLVGYSVDTDIMLTTRVLKRRSGTLDERIAGAMKTGITMSLTTIFAMAVLYLVVTFVVPAADVLANIAAVLLIGLIGDLMLTWMTNAGILKYYMSEYKKGK